MTTLPPRSSGHYRGVASTSVAPPFLAQPFFAPPSPFSGHCRTAFLQGKFPTCFPCVLNFAYIYFQFGLLRELICIGFEIVWSVLSNFVRDLSLKLRPLSLKFRALGLKLRFLVVFAFFFYYL